MATTQPNSHRFGLTRYFALQVTLLLLANSFAPSSADNDWDTNCGVCTCKWISGKKNANCRSQSFTMIPTEVSSDIQVIDLSNNPIPKLRRNEILKANLGNLHKIYMRNCSMSEINIDALFGLQVLIELDLSQNQLKLLHPGTFDGLIKLRTLLLNNNNIERLENSLFSNLPFLSKLEVRSNRLYHVGLHVFNLTVKIINIDFDHNQLSTLKKETFKNLINLKSLSLNGNPWNCTCNLQQFQKFVIANKLYTPPTSCVEPPHLRDKLWSEISSDSFACKPRIILPRTNTLVEAYGENVTLVCRISGSPKPAIEWIFNKRTINFNVQRTLIRNSQEANRRDAIDLYTSELTILGVRPMDRGDYICVANNPAGKAEVLFHVTIPMRSIKHINVGAIQSPLTNLWLVVCQVLIVLLVVLIMVVLAMCCYCRPIANYTNNDSISEKGLVTVVLDKSNPTNVSILEGSVSMDMNEVNPVEKPPRRAKIDGSGDITEEGREPNKRHFDETHIRVQGAGTKSSSFSDTTARSHNTLIEDPCGTDIPPDLLAFPNRLSQSPLIHHTVSNIHEMYDTQCQVSTYQYPSANYQDTKTGHRTLHQPRTQSPFAQATITYPVVAMKHCYVTVPRKPRAPSWTPSLPESTITSQYPLTSPGMSPDLTDAVYDNLGRRTTSSGNFAPNLHTNKKKTDAVIGPLKINR